ncbi:hypothetical protein [Mycobacterium nebraskense]|uniref:Uncharacterized protein n=1 Tax=Mycobacterium nebraskense TaxID=244292 RepID=A0A0F5N239_9MYCO|nr:hypothetical protein [Mycobacterium nebraskense]KKC00935.1 hypothetical protein WU83_29410 [Mycobacterium nebraskense]KLO33846.1 hypothetical protein ABW17_28065 [Mycobacterium nebraskense]MBI2695624.1 hypothetical protein [Mycobacterium nebraskense]MCV7116819.1 hypothetical protein [Mycobacterium nebraskense]ORW15952.1 hypothetical protein AWC17_15780 [Mycobacterium nebraskense]
MRLVLVRAVSTMAPLIIACLACPAAHADGGYGPGSYAVPGQLPYGTYVARTKPGVYSAACTFTTWTGDGKLIASDSGLHTVIAQVQAPAVAKFFTHGCTPWVKMG